MPYFVHVEGVEPSFGLPFATRADAALARQSRPDKPAITYKPTAAESAAWREREETRFGDRTYTPVPWGDHIRYLRDRLAYHLELYSAENWGPPYYMRDVARAEASERRNKLDILVDHYPHISLDQPGMIAYTPDDQYGVDDRQIRTRVGRYLEQFFETWMYPGDPAAIKTDWIDTVKAHTSALQIARTADDVERVYKNGPNSCMADSKAFAARVYGDSPDLAVAYLGDLDDARARCVVWPERKYYATVYGDSTLGNILRRDGYTTGDFSGARLRAVSSNGSYLMPYLDIGDTVDRDGPYFIVRDDGDGEYSAKNTTGFLTDRERYFCGRDGCDNEIGEDEVYCESCTDERSTCDRCSSDIWTESDDYTTAGDQTYCDSCADRLRRSCAACDETWIEEGDIAESDRLPSSHSLGGYCESCRTEHTICASCDEVVPRDDAQDYGGALHCESCLPPAEVLAVLAGYPVPAPHVITQTDGAWGRHSYRVLYSRAGFAVVKLSDDVADLRHGIVRAHDGAAIATFRSFRLATVATRTMADLCDGRRGRYTDEEFMALRLRCPYSGRIAWYY